MHLRSPLPGYGPRDYPNEVDPTQAMELATTLQANGYAVVGSCVTLEAVPIEVMVSQIEGSRRVNSSSGNNALPGPLVYEDQVVQGNAIGLWDIQ